MTPLLPLLGRLVVVFLLFALQLGVFNISRDLRDRAYGELGISLLLAGLLAVIW